MRYGWWLVMVGCGRIDFERRTDAGDATPDGTVDAPYVLGCPADALLCENFDGGSLGWTTELGAQGMVETMPGHVGTAVCLQSNVLTESAEMERTFGPLASGVLHVRVFVYTPSGQATTGEFDFLHFSDQARTQTAHMFTVGPGTNLNLEVDGNPPLFSSIAMGLDRWACIEVEMGIGTSEVATLELDGVYVGDTGPGPTDVGLAGWGRIVVGLDSFASSTPPPTRACYDELVIARSPIGCAGP